MTHDILAEAIARYDVPPHQLSGLDGFESFIYETTADCQRATRKGE